MTTQLFRGKTLTHTIVKNNILTIWKQTSNEDRVDWYGEAFNTCSNMVLDKKGVVQINEVHKAVGILSALSPQRRWNKNIELAEEFYRTGKTKHMPLLLDKAKQISESDGNIENICRILNGNKIVSFFLNIIGNDNRDQTVTIDRHALSIALGYKTNDEDYSITPNQYKFFAKCYTLAAEKKGVKPTLMQSATWVRYRKMS